MELVLKDAQANRNNCQNDHQLAHDCQSQTTEPWKEEDLYETVLHNIWQAFIAVFIVVVHSKYFLSFFDLNTFLGQ